MSRFDASRWSRIMVWTGAGLAWAAAVTASGLEPLRTVPDATVRTPTSMPDTARQAALPSQPARGLVVLRYKATEAPRPEVRTVYVRQQAPASPAAAAPAAPAAPAPQSSGS